MTRVLPGVAAPLAHLLGTEAMKASFSEEPTRSWAAVCASSCETRHGPTTLQLGQLARHPRTPCANLSIGEVFSQSYRHANAQLCGCTIYARIAAKLSSQLCRARAFPVTNLRGTRTYQSTSPFPISFKWLLLFAPRRSQLQRVQQPVRALELVQAGLCVHFAASTVEDSCMLLVAEALQVRTETRVQCRHPRMAENNTSSATHISVYSSLSLVIRQRRLILLS
jgi:hypothetical protein